MIKQKLIIIFILSMLPLVIALNNNPTIAGNGECFIEEPIRLYQGWNMIALYWNNGSYPLTGDINVA